MIKEAFAARKILSSVTHRVREIKEHAICEAEWKACEELLGFWRVLQWRLSMLSGNTIQI